MMNFFSSSSTKLTQGGDNKISIHPNNLQNHSMTLIKAETFSNERHRWSTNEEVASVLIAFDKHNEWQTREIVIRPPSGMMLLYSRKMVTYRKDGYSWKKRKDGRTTREDHMKLKVHGIECIYGCYVHSSILPTFHRRSYWLLQNPDLVLVHYLNVPLTRNNSCCLPLISFQTHEWTKEDLEDQIRPMFASLKHFDGCPTEISIQSIMNFLMNENAESNADPKQSFFSIKPVFNQLLHKSSPISLGGIISQECSSIDDFFSPQNLSNLNDVNHEEEVMKEDEVKSCDMDDLDDILSIMSAGLHGDMKLLQQSQGEEMLITGKFDSCGEYVVMFGEVGVRGQILHEGVIKCFIPAHKEGVVELNILKEKTIINNCGTFQYRSTLLKTQFNIPDLELAQMLMQKIVIITERVHCEHDLLIMKKIDDLHNKSFPQCMPSKTNKHQDLSLLHLASALGNAEMIMMLMEVRSQENTSELIKSEIDCLCEDADGNIPIVGLSICKMWACGRGKLEAFIILFHSSQHSMTLHNGENFTPTNIIQQTGYSFFSVSSSFPSVIKKHGVDMGTQTSQNNIFECTSNTSTSLKLKWPTDNDVCLPYRRSLDGNAPMIFGAHKAKDYFIRQCQKETPTGNQAIVKHHKPNPSKLRSESFNEDTFDFGLKIFRNANSEPLLSNKKINFVAPDVSDLTILTDIDLDIALYDFMDSGHMITLANQIITSIPERNKLLPQDDSDKNPILTRQGEPKEDGALFHSCQELDILGMDDSGIGTPMERISSLFELRSTPLFAWNPSSYFKNKSIDFKEYFNAPATYVEEDFSLLTLSDDEQKKLYKAATIIQNFFGRHKGDKSRQEEIDAAKLMQNCCRRYKQFVYYKKMNQAAVLIQSRFRSYYARKRYRRSREAATIIQNGYRAYKEHQRHKRNKIINMQQRFRNQSTLIKYPIAVSIHKIMEATNNTQKDQRVFLDSDGNLDLAGNNFKTS